MAGGLIQGGELYADPLAGGCRLQDTVDHALDADGISEGWVERLSVGDAIQQVAHLNYLEIVEAELMPSGLDEGRIGRVSRTGEDFLEAQIGRVIGRAIQLDLVQAFLVEEDGALVAMDFKGEAVLASPG